MSDIAIEKARKAEQEAHDNMVMLFAAIITLPQDKTNPFTYTFKADSIIHTGSREKATIEITFPTLKDARYKTVKVYYTLRRPGFSSYGDYKTFVRIESDNWETKHKHNWTFLTKDLAKKVHAKVGEMVKELKYLDNDRKEKTANAETVKSFLQKKFGTSRDVYATGGKGSAYLPEGKTEYRLDNNTFSIELHGLTEAQFDKVLAIKNETNRCKHDVWAADHCYTCEDEKVANGTN